jgi:dTDP-4-amino-4,6-dideoxygalactose transaminase
MDQIPVFKPLLGQEEIDASRKALELGWLGMGSYVAEFETALKKYTEAGDRHVVACSTGYAALHLALVANGVGPGDEVITPSFNNITDFQAILATGAKPVLCDVLDDSLGIDVSKAAELVTPRTKAVIATDYGCMLCDHDALGELAARHGLRLIHDASHSIGSRHRGRMIGSFSDITTFSFDPIKTVTCIDGGALVVRTPEEVELLHELRLVGMGQPSAALYTNTRAWTYDVKRLGFRYHLANMHAAIGLAQMAKLPGIVESRVATCRFYHSAFRDLPGIAVPRTDFADISPFIYYVRVKDGRRDALRAYLGENRVDCGIHWQPGHWFTLLKGERRGDLTVTEAVGREILTLPLHSEMPRAWSERVVEVVRAFFRRS